MQKGPGVQRREQLNLVFKVKNVKSESVGVKKQRSAKAQYLWESAIEMHGERRMMKLERQARDEMKQGTRGRNFDGLSW